MFKYIKKKYTEYKYKKEKRAKDLLIAVEITATYNHLTHPGTGSMWECDEPGCVEARKILVGSEQK